MPVYRYWVASLVFLQVVFVSGLLHGQIFVDQFADNQLGWQVESRAGNFGVGGSSIVEFGFDYSEVGVPEAPNSPAGSDPTKGLRLRTNLAGFSEDQVAASLESPQITGNYRLEVDMWLNWAPDPNLIGTTLHAGPFVGKPTEDNPVEALKPVEQGAGILLSSDGDCSNCDFILLKNEAEADLFSGQYAVGYFVNDDETDEPINQPGIDNTDITPGDFNDDGFVDIADFTAWRDNDLEQIDYDRWFANFGNEKLDMPNFFPSFDLIDAVGDEVQPIEDPVTFEFYQQPRGAAGFQWVTVEVDVFPDDPGSGTNGATGTATFSLKPANIDKTILIGTVDNSVVDDPSDGFDTGEGPVDLTGRVSLTLIDFFAGGPADPELGFVLYDNLRLTSLDGTEAASVPEPNQTTIFGLGLVLLLGSNRRNRRRHSA